MRSKQKSQNLDGILWSQLINTIVQPHHHFLQQELSSCFKDEKCHALDIRD